MSIKERFNVHRVDNNNPILRDYLLNYHYLRRLPQRVVSYGLFEGNKIIGVITYGTPSATLTKVFDNEILELTRLYIIDNDVPNLESYLIRQSMKMMRKDAPQFKYFISYAQMDANHLGYVYQATSWWWCGYSAKNKDVHIKGYIGTHSRTIFSQFKDVKTMKELFGDYVIYIERPKKIRYFTTNRTKRERKKIMDKVNSIYPILEGYPKHSDKEVQEEINKQISNKKLVDELKAKNDIYKKELDEIIASYKSDVDEKQTSIFEFI